MNKKVKKILGIGVICSGLLSSFTQVKAVEENACDGKVTIKDASILISDCSFLISNKGPHRSFQPGDSDKVMLALDTLGFYGTALDDGISDQELKGPDLYFYQKTYDFLKDINNRLNLNLNLNVDVAKPKDLTTLADQNSKNKKLKLIDTKTKEIKKLGNFDEMPLSFFDKGYLVKKDGKFGFIDMNGDYVVEPKYPAYYVDEIEYPDKLLFVNEAISSVENSGIALDKHLKVENLPKITNGGFGGVAGFNYTIENNQLMLNYQPRGEMVSDESIKIPVKEVLAYNDAKIKDQANPITALPTTDAMCVQYVDGQKMYINPLGDYYVSEKDPKYTSLNERMLNDSIATNRNPMMVESLVVAKDDGKLKLLDKTGVYTPNLKADDYQIVSKDAAMFTKDNKKGIVTFNEKKKDNNYNGYRVLAYGDFEELAKPVKNKMLVKNKNGEWVLVKLKNNK